MHNAPRNKSIFRSEITLPKKTLLFGSYNPVPLQLKSITLKPRFSAVLVGVKRADIGSGGIEFISITAHRNEYFTRSNLVPFLFEFQIIPRNVALVNSINNMLINSGVHRCDIYCLYEQDVRWADTNIITVFHLPNDTILDWLHYLKRNWCYTHMKRSKYTVSSFWIDPSDREFIIEVSETYFVSYISNLSLSIVF